MLKAENCGFRSAVRKAADDKPRGWIAKLAEKIKIDEHDLRNRLAGRVYFTPEEARAIIAEANDQHLASWFFHGSQFLVALRPTATSHISELVALMANFIREAPDVWEAISEVSSLQQLSPKGLKDFEEELVEVEIAIASLRECLERAKSSHA